MTKFYMFTALAIIIALFYNTGRMILLWLKLVIKNINPVFYWCIYIFLVLGIIAMFILSRAIDFNSVLLLFKISQYAMGFYAYILMAVNLTALILFIVKLTKLLPSDSLRLFHTISGGVCLAVIGFFCIYGSANGAKLKTANYEITINNLEMRIVMVSDIHLGYIIDDKRFKEIVEEINRQNPDIVCIAGDLTDGGVGILKNPQRIKDLYNSIDSKYGVFACLGNHDAGNDYDNIIKFFEDTQVRILNDEYIKIDGHFIVMGRRDSSPIGSQGEKRSQVSILPEDMDLPIIVMDHQPANISEYGGATNLILSGHTHKGQMFPFNYITNAINTVDYGYYRADEKSPHVIVSSGAGTWGPPMRVGSYCEVVVINVRSD